MPKLTLSIQPSLKRAVSIGSDISDPRELNREIRKLDPYPLADALLRALRHLVADIPRSSRWTTVIEEHDITALFSVGGRPRMIASQCLRTLGFLRTQGFGRPVFLYHADSTGGKVRKSLKDQRRKKDRVGITDQVPRRGNRSDTLLGRRHKRLPLRRSGSAVRRGVLGRRYVQLEQRMQHDTTENGPKPDDSNRKHAGGDQA